MTRRPRRRDDLAGQPGTEGSADVGAELEQLRSDVGFLAASLAALIMPAGSHLPSVLIRNYGYSPGAAARLAELVERGRRP